MNRHERLEWDKVQASWKLMLKNWGHSMKRKELAVNRMLLVMIKRRANTFFMIVQRKVLKAAEVFATAVKRWSQGKNINQKITLRLQRRAARHGRSMEEEVRDMLRNAVKDQDAAAGGLGTEIASLFANVGLEEDIPELRGYQTKSARFDRRSFSIPTFSLRSYGTHLTGVLSSGSTSNLAHPGRPTLAPPL